MIWKIALKNILHKPLNSILCISLVLFGVSIISLLLIIKRQFENKLKQDLEGIDLVIGAKGSPLQLVLSSIYHLDAPTGNIDLSEVNKIVKGPMIEEAIPLAYGDSYQGFRILGTTPAYIEKYDAKLKEGNVNSAPMETIFGTNVAEKTGLHIGDTFLGTHGEMEEGHVHANQYFKVVGILDQSNSVLDNLILTEIESVWQVHSSHDSNHDHRDSSKQSNHDHSGDHVHDSGMNQEITAVLIKCKSKLDMMRLPRAINQQTNMQAVIPGLEINRLFYMLGIGVTTLKWIAGGIMLMAGFSVFLVLYVRLHERKQELALMRSVGYRPIDLFWLLLLEGGLLAVIGYVLGTLVSRLGLYFINLQAEKDYNLQFNSGYSFDELGLLLLILLLGIISSLLPAYKAMRMDVSAVLSES